MQNRIQDSPITGGQHTSHPAAIRIDGQRDLLLALLLVNGAALVTWWMGYGIVVSQEHGIIEDAQLLVLLLSLALFWFGWRHGDGAAKIASGALAMLVLAAFIRELDVKMLESSWWFRGLQKILLVALALLTPWYLIKRRQHWPGIMKLLFAPAAVPLFIAGALLMLSFYFDRRLVVLNAGLRFWEEFIELNGFMFLLMSARNHWVIIRDRSARP